ncbi:MAG: RyR domain-containing protein [candidate division WOR-3 bacterium]
MAKRESLFSRLRELLVALIKNWWFWILVFGLVGVGLGICGFLKYLDGRNIFDILYRTLQLLVLEFSPAADPSRAIPPQLHLARFLLAFAAFSTAILTILRLFAEQIQLLKVKCYGNHIIVCGLGEKGFALVEKLQATRHKVVVIEQDKENDLIGPARELGAKVIIGNAEDEETLRKANVQMARCLFAVTRDDEKNAEIALTAQKVMEKEPPSKWLTCLAHVHNPSLCHLLSGGEFANVGTNGHLGANFALEFFSIYRIGARALVTISNPFEPVPGRLSGLPHILLFGTGPMGRCLTERLCREWYQRPSSSLHQFQLELVGPDAPMVAEELALHFPRLSSCCRLVGHGVDVPSDKFERGSFLFNVRGECDLTKIYVCLESGPQSLQAALVLSRRLRGLKVPIYAVVRRERGLQVIPQGGEECPILFGLLDQAFQAEPLGVGGHDTIAQALHASFLRRTFEDPELSDEELERPSSRPWRFLDDEFRISSWRSVGFIGYRLNKIGCRVSPMVDWDARQFQFTAAEVEELARMEHERWVAERRAAGWKHPDELRASKRKLAGHKRTNRWLTEWGRLDEPVREYNREMVRQLPQLLAAVDLQIERVVYEKLAEAFYYDFLPYPWCIDPDEPKDIPVGDNKPWAELEENDLRKQWHRERARRLVGALGHLGYRLVPAGSDNALTSRQLRRILIQLVRLQNPRFRDFTARVKKGKLIAALRLPAIIQAAGFEIIDDEREVLAKANHELYMNPARGRPADRPWAELAEYFRESNRGAVDHIAVKLRAIGCEARPESCGLPPYHPYGPEVLFLARMEHERWMKERFDAGWQYGERRDDARKVHNLLKPWESLPDTKEGQDAQGWNIKQIHDIPAVLGRVGKIVVLSDQEAVARLLCQFRIGLGPACPFPTPPPNDWHQLSEEQKVWFRERAANILVHLWALGYEVRPGTVSHNLSLKETEQLCELENPDWSALDDAHKDAQRQNVKTLFGLLAQHYKRTLVLNQLERLAAGFYQYLTPDPTPWHKLPDSDKASARNTATFVWRLLEETFSFRIVPVSSTLPQAEIPGEKLARMFHHRWMGEMLSQGWWFAPEFDRERKTDPRLVVWSRLNSQEQQRYLAVAQALHDIFGAAGLMIVPRPDERMEAEHYPSAPIKTDIYENLARAIHEDYVAKQKEQGVTPEQNPSMVPWDRLPDDLRKSNRQAARHIWEKLRAIGCIIVSAEEGTGFDRFSPEEIEKMAEMEHDRWVRERRNAGWTYGDSKDLEKRTSPYLVPWHCLPEEIKELDRNQVRLIPEVLARVGLGIRRRA